MDYVLSLCVGFKCYYQYYSVFYVIFLSQKNETFFKFQYPKQITGKGRNSNIYCKKISLTLTQQLLDMVISQKSIGEIL